MTLPGPVSGEDGRTKSTKRKAIPHHQSPSKRSRLSEVDGPSSISQNEFNKGNKKRKWDEEEEEEPSRAPKKPKGLPGLVLNDDTTSSLNIYSCSNISESCKSEVCCKRKAFSTEEARKKVERAEAQRAEFEAKYKEEGPICSGGFGSVFAGYRKEDNLPVAIKHIPNKKVLYEHTDQDGNELSAEVAVMKRLESATTNSVGKSAPVALLDWYELKQELILVLERPVSAVDLFEYRADHGGTLLEDEAKVIVKQLINAAIYLQENCIFHRDIKLENILIETDSDIPRVRLIDFGMSCIYKENTEFNKFCGTVTHIPPEALAQHTHSAIPTTVWQIGVVLFEILHTKDFLSNRFIHKTLRISETLPEECQDFLKKCLTIDPEKRPTLEDLRSHPWLT
ncbi:serine/threonine-protein kinase pim-1-like [Melanotaenia boesemani]|uniref:serine/threonine-protein kinase pim-1-like n=1 Tax=Melanotaenia boesemani TaxID=1250792 RepID=UPI001C0414B2|nr:serine/threonine-protein kinase pim-1-like [Melanotaenia boesemani]